MNAAITFGSKIIQYAILFTDRKTLGIYVLPDMQVEVRAPIGTSPEKISTLVRKRASWILKQQAFFLGFHPKTPAKKYVGGESHLYLGRQYKLRLEIAKRNGLSFDGRVLRVLHKPSASPAKILKDWYYCRAKLKFPEIAEPLIQRFSKYGVTPTEIFLQEMQTRWGSCTPKGKIILNPELVKAPVGCIEYVIIHELCHLIHKNHSARFFDLQKKEMPDWEKWKKKLERLLQ